MDADDQRSRDSSYLLDIPEIRASLDRLGDQRAKDLIDRNESETDPRRAIRRLHRALRYGRHSIQAAKAYQRLGMYYEDLGNTARAILYYTKAIELDQALDIVPLPGLYWRGQLHAERGEVEAARRDFEQALRLDDARTFFPEERAQAESYLAETGPRAEEQPGR